jgi:hypothetical protein
MPRAKRLTLTPTDKEFIQAYCDTMTPKQLYEKLGKSQKHIKDYIENVLKKDVKPNRSKLPEVVPKDDRQLRLRNSPEWKMLQGEFNPAELDHIDFKYQKNMEQFDWDVYPTEEEQLIQALKLEIMMHRVNKAQKIAEDDIDRLTKLLDREQKKAVAEQHQDVIENLINRIKGLTDSASYNAKTFHIHHKAHMELMEGLKGTREQRVKVSTDSKTTFKDLVEDVLSEPKNEITRMELVRLATDLEYKRLSEVHIFMDGMGDQPIYNHETVGLVEDVGALKELEHAESPKEDPSL